MELKDFVKSYLLYAKIPISEIPTKASFEFAKAFIEDLQCRNWYIKQRLKDLEVDPDKFCCLELAGWNLEELTQKKENDQKRSPEKFVVYWDEFRAYGITHSSRTFCIPIDFCPWCGKRLPQFDYYTTYT